MPTSNRIKTAPMCVTLRVIARLPLLDQVMLWVAAPHESLQSLNGDLLRDGQRRERRGSRTERGGEGGCASVHDGK